MLGYKKHCGFSLIELLVVIVIIIIIYGIGLATIDFASFNTKDKLSAQINNIIVDTKGFALKYNKISRIVIDNENGLIFAEYFDTYNNIWHKTNKVNSIDFVAKKQESLLQNFDNQYILVKPISRIAQQEITINLEDEFIDINIGDADDTISIFN